MRQTVLVVLPDEDARQRTLAVLRATPDLLPAAARSLDHALAVLAEMRVDLLLVDATAAASADLARLGGVPLVPLKDGNLKPEALLGLVRAAIPARPTRLARPP